MEINELKSPKDIPLGTIFVQHWLNSISYYKLVGTSAKSVTFVEVPKKQVRFENEGGFTGHSYVKPDLDRLAELEKSFGELVNEIGINPFDCSDKEWEKLPDSKKNKVWSANIWNHKSSFKPKRIMVKPCKDGGFYIPGVQRGSWCGNMHIWNGEENSEYFA